MPKAPRIAVSDLMKQAAKNGWVWEKWKTQSTQKWVQSEQESQLLG